MAALANTAGYTFDIANPGVAQAAHHACLVGNADCTQTTMRWTIGESERLEGNEASNRRDPMGDRDAEVGPANKESAFFLAVEEGSTKESRTQSDSSDRSSSSTLHPKATTTTVAAAKQAESEEASNGPGHDRKFSADPSKKPKGIPLKRKRSLAAAGVMVGPNGQLVVAEEDAMPAKPQRTPSLEVTSTQPKVLLSEQRRKTVLTHGKVLVVHRLETLRL